MTESAKPIWLWLDDIRPAPHGWTHVKTVDEAKALLETGRVTFASFDYHLGFMEEPATVLVEWMAQSGHWPSKTPSVHSEHPTGAWKMKTMLSELGPYGREGRR